MGDAVLLQQRPQLLVLLGHTAGSKLHLGRRLNTELFECADTLLELLLVFLTSGTGAALVVADPREIGLVLNPCKYKRRRAGVEETSRGDTK